VEWTQWADWPFVGINRRIGLKWPSPIVRYAIVCNAANQVATGLALFPLSSQQAKTLLGK
jgi:hypothetical protein